MTRTNHVKEQLRAGKPSFGCWLSLPSIEATRVVARLGFDWVVVDGEHVALDPNTLGRMIGAIVDIGKAAPLVRLPANSVEWYKWSLDAGAWGVIVPMVNSRADAERAVAFSRYPPAGQRSFGGGYSAYSFGLNSMAEYAAAANDQILVIPQIESAAALENLEAILSVPGLDAAFVGPNDLHLQIGLPPSSEGAEPAFVEALDRIKAEAAKHKLPLAIFCSDGAAAAARVAEGFQMVSVTTDLNSMRAAAQANLQRARGSS
jgi:4-hydroxy-2-oxoheptanedioate aldolase